MTIAHRLVAEWLASDLDDPEQVYPELERRIATALARRDAEIARLRSGCGCHGEEAAPREPDENSALTVVKPLR